jgi:hypothetical protein
MNEVIVEKRLTGAAGRIAELRIARGPAASLQMCGTVRNGIPAGEAWHFAASLAVTVSLRHPVGCRIETTGNAGPPPSARDVELGNPFALVGRWTAAALVDDSTIEVDPRYAWDSDRATSLRRLIHRVLACVGRDVRAAVAELNDAGAWTLAGTFAPDARDEVYAALLADPTGRVHQLVAACPGVFTLAQGAPAHAAEDLVARVRAGVRVGALLDWLLELIEASRRTRPGWQPLPRGTKALVRRVPAWLGWTQLERLLTATHVDLNDWPASDEDLEAWLAAMFHWSLHARAPLDDAATRSLGAFISRHGATLPALGLDISEICDWATSSGDRVPGRRTSPTAVRRAIDAWHKRLHTAVVDPDCRLASGPVAARSVPGLEITPLRTPAELQREGEDLLHCVASLAPHAVAGQVFLYGATTAEGRLTIAIARGPHGWRLQEARGLANRRPSAVEAAAIARWIEILVEVTP